MTIFSNCCDECCVCACAGFCMAGHGDDNFIPASKEKIIERLHEDKYNSYKTYMIEYLLGHYGYAYEEHR